jgi:hypothetical protein
VPITSSGLCDLRIRVLVEQAAESRTADDEVVGGRGGRSLERWCLSKRPMWPVGVVVVDVDGEHVFQVASVDDQCPVEQFAA